MAAAEELAYHLSAQRSADGQTIALTLRADQIHTGSAQLQLRRRGTDEVLRFHCNTLAEDAWLAEIQLTTLQALPGRWDAQLCWQDQDDSRRTPLFGVLDPSMDRHFFVTDAESAGVSFYLSDSICSLVLYVAAQPTHARTVAAENAKARFPHDLRALPLRKELVIFESFLGKTYAGNPRYIYEALQRLRPDLHCVWAYDGPQAIPGNPQRVARGSPEYYRLLAQAKYRVNNVLFPVHGRKPETIYLQTWHGTPLKKLSHDIEVAGPEAEARENFYHESRAWTCLLSANPYSSDIFRRAFRYDGHVLETGYPLADPLVNGAADRQALAHALGLPANRRFVLYAPTWRDHKPIGAWRFDFDLRLDLEQVARALAPDQMLLIKAHHLVARHLDPASLPVNVIDMSHVGDINELCLLADVLITDYSSVLFDFAATGRPMLFYCYDLAEYAKQIRGFYMDVEAELPGPVVATTAELVEALSDLHGMQQRYAARYARFRQQFCALNDGRAAERVVRAVFGVAA